MFEGLDKTIRFVLSIYSICKTLFFFFFVHEHNRIQREGISFFYSISSESFHSISTPRLSAVTFNKDLTVREFPLSLRILFKIIPA